MESVYDVVLARDLVLLSLRVERQKVVSLEFEGTLFEDAFRPDLMINVAVIGGVKAARAPDPVFARQLLTYRKIMNFGMATMKDGNRCVAD